MRKAFLLILVYSSVLGQEEPMKIVDFQARFWNVVQTDSVLNPAIRNVLPAPPVFVSFSVNEREGQELVCYLTDGLMTFDTLRMGHNPTINFFNLPGGEYTATFIDLKSDRTVDTHFIIQSEFWERWWFPPFVLLVFTVMIAIVFYYIYKIRLRQQLQTQSIRDNIARDLHDDIGSYLGSISILSQSVDTLIVKNPEKARLSVEKIGDTARQVMDTMGDIVWSINSNHDSMPMVVQRMRDLASELLSEQGIATTFSVDESIEKLSLTLDKRRDFYLIYKEAVTNIQKYAKASKVAIALRTDGDEVSITVADDGVGFDPLDPNLRKSNGGNGLINMKARAERLGGALTIVSEAGAGTRVRFVFVL